MSDLSFRSALRDAAVEPEAELRLRRERCRHGQCCAHDPDLHVQDYQVDIRFCPPYDFPDDLYGVYGNEQVAYIRVESQTEDELQEIVERICDFLDVSHPDPIRNHCHFCGVGPGERCVVKGTQRIATCMHAVRWSRR